MQGLRFDPWWGELRSHMLHCMLKIIIIIIMKRTVKEPSRVSIK